MNEQQAHQLYHAADRLTEILRDPHPDLILWLDALQQATNALLDVLALQKHPRVLS